MTSQPVRPRTFVMLLIGWCAISAAPVVALSPPGAATFFVLALGLVAVVTLRLSVAAAGVLAALGTAGFAVVLTAGPVAVTALGPDLADRLGAGLARPPTLTAVVLGAVALAGGVGFGGLAAAGLEWDAIKREVAASSAATSEAESRPAPVGGTAALPDAHPEREREYELEEDL